MSTQVPLNPFPSTPSPVPDIPSTPGTDLPSGPASDPTPGPAIDPIPDLEPASPSLPDPDPGVFRNATID